jgi:hypothetical protein
VLSVGNVNLGIPRHHKETGLGRSPNLLLLTKGVEDQVVFDVEGHRRKDELVVHIVYEVILYLLNVVLPHRTVALGLHLHQCRAGPG